MDLVKITYPAALTAADVDRMAAILQDADVPAQLSPAQARRGSLHLDPWTIVITATATAYLTSMAQEAGQSTGSALVQLIRHLASCHPARHPAADAQVEIEDRQMVFVFPETLAGDIRAEQGMDALIRDPAAEAGIYFWDIGRRDWALS